jgi:hypothetical protein
LQHPSTAEVPHPNRQTKQRNPTQPSDLIARRVPGGKIDETGHFPRIKKLRIQNRCCFFFIGQKYRHEKSSALVH